MLTFRLPYPPSVNLIWRISNHGGNYLSDSGKKFYEQTGRLIRATKFIPFKATDRLYLKVTLHRGDRRSYDISNTVKVTEDALVRGGVMPDDSQIDVLFVERGDVVKGDGHALVEIGNVDDALIRLTRIHGG